LVEDPVGRHCVVFTGSSEFEAGCELRVYCSWEMYTVIDLVSMYFSDCGLWPSLTDLNLAFEILNSIFAGTLNIDLVLMLPERLCGSQCLWATKLVSTPYFRL
jgi:hypothetical protein